MTPSFVLTVIGPDRPGLVAALARVVVTHQGNWLESRMSQLGGHFAGIVRVQLPAEREASARLGFNALAAEGIVVTVASDTAWLGREPQEPTMALDIVGNDRPGIVQQVTGVLATLGVNVEALDTDCTAAPWSGEPLFEARLRIRLPQGVTPAILRGDLERITAELMVDFTLGLK